MIREETDFSLTDLSFDKFPEPILPSESMPWSPVLQMHQRSGQMNTMSTGQAGEWDTGSGSQAVADEDTVPHLCFWASCTASLVPVTKWCFFFLNLTSH